MLLKSIELQGYKTFAGRTHFEFAGAITAIVGPNGSGKSNVADSIRWVLGEQSYSLLRGKKTEDMIFSGSQHRPRAGMASATIIFDNQAGWLPVDFTEVSITRRAYRDGNNEYLINNQKVRLKDITELLGNSGLSERTYTIIGQGLVDATLALRAEERRRLFEEAAGIGLYRSRREEAYRRLNTTQRNLERVEDILAELKPRLRSLERQARRAEQYEQVEKDLRLLLREYYGYHWYRAQKDLNAAREDARVQQTVYEAVRKEQTELDQRLTQYREQIQGLRARLGSWSRQSSQLHTQREEITRDLAVSDERSRSTLIQQQRANDEFDRLEQQIILARERVAESEKDVQRRTEEVEEARSQLKAVNQALLTRQAERVQAEKNVRDHRQQLSKLHNQQNRLQARLTERENQLEQQQNDLQTAQKSFEKAQNELQGIETRLQAAKNALENIAQLRQQADQNLNQQRAQIGTVETQIRELQNAQTQEETQLARLNAQLDVLVQAERALSGYANGTQLLLKAPLRGLDGALSSQLDVPEEIETAVLAALGEYLDAVLLADSDASDSALELLVAKAARGALLPLDKLIPSEPLTISNGDGVLGVAAKLVNSPPKLRPAVDLLLGQTIIVADRQVARKILAGQNRQVRAVTLQGELFHASGQIVTAQQGQASTLSRPRQRRELQNEIANTKTRMATTQNELQRVRTQIAQMRAEELELDRKRQDAQRQEKAANDTYRQVSLDYDRIKRQVNWQKDQYEKLQAAIQKGDADTHEIKRSLNQLHKEVVTAQDHLRAQQNTLSGLSLEEFQTQANHWKTQVAVADQAMQTVQAQLGDRQAGLMDIVKSRQSLQTRMQSFESDLATLETKMTTLRASEAEVVAQIDALRALVDPTQAELDQAEKDHENLLTTATKARQGLSLADRRHSQAQLTLTRKQELLDNLRERIEDDLGLVSLEYQDEISGPRPLPFGEMVENLPMVSELSDGLEQNIKRQRAQARRMGSINPEAQTEYKEVKERFEFMSTQVEDLHKAEKDIKEVIAELDVLMEREFRKTFDLVAAEFREIFTRLFGGGSARLVLTDPEDLTDTGIDIEARLPGRRTQGLSLLSGGERSLTATALVFSLLKVSPTPFCVLDEVDAMLDEANVGRFRDLLRELAEKTQFIVITHNRNTVQAADVIYGVTMGRDSASQMISLKLDEVAEVVSG